MFKNGFTEYEKWYVLRDPKIAPTSDAFLYNTRMFLKATCHGYVVSYFMQSLIPTSYSHPPIQPARTFILPEPKYYTHHQGRFFYLKDNETKYPYFTIGFPSWVHSAAEYNEKTGGIVAKSIMPYQKTEDYFKNKDLKDLTYFLPDIKPGSWQANNQNRFEGDGGLHNPDGLKMKQLEKIDSYYENSAGILQFSNILSEGESFTVHLAFGPTSKRY